MVNIDTRMKDNTNNLKSQAYSQILNLCHLICGDSPLWNWSDKNKCFIPKSIDKKEIENEKLVPGNLAYTNNKQGRKKDSITIYDKLAWFRKICERRNPTRKECVIAARIITNSCQWLNIQKADGTSISVEAYAKGTERYCKKLNGRILDICKEIGAKNLDCAFITLTCDQSKYKNLADCWQNYNEKEVKPVMENWRKNYGVEYIAVMESTLRKRPHIHILAFFPKGMYPELEKCENETILTYGKLFNEVQRNKLSQEVEIKVVKGENKVHYLTKYVGKGSVKSVFKVLESKDEISDEDWKLLFEFVFLTAFRRRKLLATRKGCKSDTVHETTQAEVSVSVPTREDWCELSDAERRSILNSICINSLLNNPKTIYSMSYNEYKGNFGVFPERKQQLSDEETKIFETKGHLVYEERNFFTDFVGFVQNPLHSPLNRKFYWDAEQDIYDLFTDNYDLKNDEDFLRCCKDLIELYLKKCCEQGYKYADVLLCKEGLSNVKKLRRYAFNTFDVAVSDDPKEVYYNIDELLTEKRKKNLILQYLQEGYPLKVAKDMAIWNLTNTEERNKIIDERVKEWMQKNEKEVN